MTLKRCGRKNGGNYENRHVVSVRATAAVQLQHKSASHHQLRAIAGRLAADAEHGPRSLCGKQPDSWQASQQAESRSVFWRRDAGCSSSGSLS